MFTDLFSDDLKLYTDSVSINAASLQCCAYLIALYDEHKPSRILDLGSGISSYCLRTYKALHSLDTEIWSIDSDEEWLGISRRYSSSRGLGDQGFELWEDIKDKQETFDLIFVDIDMSPKRELYFDAVFNQFSKPGTIVLLDDMHKSVIATPFDKLMEESDYTESDIKDLTIDEYGRYSRLVTI